MRKRLLGLIGLCLALAACGGGDGGSSPSSGVATPTAASTTTTVTPPALTNFTTITVDNGPAALNVGTNAYTAANTPYVSVKLCAPGSTTNCQTIDHVLVDTGSVGLRIFASVINAGLLSAAPLETDPSANPVGTCYGFIDGYLFGSVRQADFQIGGEAVANMPFMAIADTGVFATIPTSCSSGGGTNENNVQALGANGIIGIGVTATDCGTACIRSGGYGAAIYYDCAPQGCSQIIARAASSSAPFQQLPNPVAAMAVDNNGTIISLPAVPTAGQATLTGTLYFGIGTQTNNGLGSATVLTATPSTGTTGVGLLTATYNGATLDQSFIDSGSTAYFFVDASIPTCTQSQLKGYYCPTSAITLSPTLKGQNGVTAPAAFILNNTASLASSNFAVLPGIGVNPNLVSALTAYTRSFDFGLPFFYGRNIVVAIEGRNAGGFTGPYFAY